MNCNELNCILLIFYIVFATVVALYTGFGIAQKYSPDVDLERFVHE